MVFDIVLYTLIALNALPIMAVILWGVSQPFLWAYHAIGWRRDLTEQAGRDAVNPARIPRRVDLRDTEKVGLWLGRHDLAQR
jgi:hypothetical protein